MRWNNRVVVENQASWVFWCNFWILRGQNVKWIDKLDYRCLSFFFIPLALWLWVILQRFGKVMPLTIMNKLTLNHSTWIVFKEKESVFSSLTLWPLCLCEDLCFSQQALNLFKLWENKKNHKSLFVLPACAGLTSHTQPNPPLSNAASNFLTSFALREHSSVYIKEKPSTWIWGAILQVRERHSNNNYLFLVLVILCVHESHFQQGWRRLRWGRGWFCFIREEVDLLKTVILFPRLPHPPALPPRETVRRWSGSRRSQNLHHALFRLLACLAGSWPIWVLGWSV